MPVRQLVIPLSVVLPCGRRLRGGSVEVEVKRKECVEDRGRVEVGREGLKGVEVVLR